MSDSQMDIVTLNNVLLDLLQGQVMFWEIYQPNCLNQSWEKIHLLFVGDTGMTWALEWKAAPPASYLQNYIVSKGQEIDSNPANLNIWARLSQTIE